jgi:excinuclease UvrABC helicase subunit UvrB
VTEVKTLLGEGFKSLEELPRSIAKLETQMKALARDMKFEEAALLRDKIRRLRFLSTAV